MQSTTKLIELTRGSHSEPIVFARIRHPLGRQTAPLPFIVDTAAQSTLISPRVAESCGILAHGQVTIMTPSGTCAQYETASFELIFEAIDGQAIIAGVDRAVIAPFHWYEGRGEVGQRCLLGQDVLAKYALIISPVTDTSFLVVGTDVAAALEHRGDTEKEASAKRTLRHLLATWSDTSRGVGGTLDELGSIWKPATDPRVKSSATE